MSRVVNIDDREEVNNYDNDDNGEILVEVNVPRDKVADIADCEDECPEF